MNGHAEDFQRDLRELRQREKRFADYINNFISKYPVLGNEIKWKWESSIGIGKSSGNDNPQEIICYVFNFIESYSMWRTELDGMHDHQKVRFINVRINKWHQILKCFESDNALIILAETEMSPDLLEEKKSLDRILSQYTTKDNENSKENFKDANSEISDSLIMVESHSMTLNKDKSINRIRQSHLICLFLDLNLKSNHLPIEIYRRLSTFFVNLDGKPFNEKSFLSALTKENIVKKPTENINEIQSKIKELFAF